MPPASLDRLRGRLVPFELHFFQRVGSTNDMAAQLLASGKLRPSALVVAGHQTAGRGQRGRSWFSPPAGLAATFVLSAAQDCPVHHLPVLVGLTVREVLAGVVGEGAGTDPALSGLGQDAPPEGPVQVKWPNDVLINGRKVAGILCERKHGADIVGIGVNIRHDPGEVPTELRESIIALADVCPAPDRWEVLAAICEAIRKRVLESRHEESWQWVVQAWCEHDALLGQLVEVTTPQDVFQGTADGIDEDGCLRLRLATGEARVVASGGVRRLSSSSAG